MTWIKKHLTRIGLALIAAGFGYEMFFAKVPKQDVVADVVRFNRNDLTSLTLMQIGLAVLLAGIAIKLLTRKKTDLY